MRKITLPLFAWLITALVYLVSFHLYGNWKNGAIVRGGDQMGYYIYEPSIFIYHDLGSFDKTIGKVFSFGHYGRSDKNPIGIEEFNQTNTGKYVVKYTMGVAMLQVPFFFIAHMLALIIGLPADGFSNIYIYFNCLSGIFYSLSGLWILIKILKQYFSDWVTSIVILTVGLATNLYYMQVTQGAMAHPYLFFLFAVMLYGTIRFYEKPGFGWLSAIAISCSMITLIRPNEGICLLIPALYSVLSIADLKARVFLFFKNPLFLLTLFLGFILPLLPQLIYWKLASGNWLFYSYGNEGFNFHHPHIIRGLTGWKNGWLSYTPVMIFAVAGMALLYFKNRSWFIPIILFFCIHVVVIYSWWCWQYINGFGSRPMVDIYPLMAIPMGCFFQWVFTFQPAKWILAPILVFFTWLNMFQTYQNSANILWSEDANRTYVLHTVGKMHVSKTDLIEFDTDESQPCEEKIAFDHVLFSNDMEDSVYNDERSSTAHSGKYAYLLTKEKQFGPSFNITAKEGHFAPGDWIHISAWCRNEDFTCSLYRQSEIPVDFVKQGVKGGSIKWKTVRIQNKIANKNNETWSFTTNQWDSVAYFTQVPDNFAADDTLKVYTWNPFGTPVFIDDMKVEVYKPKK